MFTAEISNLTRSDGSALFSIGETIVQASVYGPTDIKISKELCDKAVVEVSFKPKVGQTTCEEKLLEAEIRSAVESIIITSLHPRKCINIIIQEIQDFGNLLACSINAACLALLDASISMKGVVAAISIGISENKLIPFPSVKEQKVSKNITLIINSNGKSIIGIKSSSFISEDKLSESFTIGKEISDDIFTFYKDSIKKRYN